MPPLSRVCVYLGSRPGNDPSYLSLARDVGGLLARRGLALVYGGGNVGLMGALADGVIDGGGQVIGVIPRSMVDREIAHRGCSELHVVGTMHERKALMEQLSDGFLTLPGGTGTLDELFEIFTWAQLGIHDKPIALLDAGGFWRPLVACLDHMVAAGFLRPAHREMLLVDGDADRLLEAMATRRAGGSESPATASTVVP